MSLDIHIFKTNSESQHIIDQILIVEEEEQEEVIYNYVANSTDMNEAAMGIDSTRNIFV
jgi:hypothetical protein